MAQIKIWEPENAAFWAKEGKTVAYRNLWISIPSLLLSFAIWVIWSVLAVNLNNIGFHFTTAQLFTLTALPGLIGATLRIVYSFTVPIFGGRNWTVISTALLLIPAFGIGAAVKDPTTTFGQMALWSALCGLGGGNFASSMANISFFFPKKLQGTALGLNGGLGNLGVSVAQFVIPLIIGIGVFGGQTQTWNQTGVHKAIWLQNAAYIWIVPILLTTIIAFFGMNNLPTAKASLAEQFVIFRRKHMYLLTWLYTTAFGSFIGYSAAFPLLIKAQFPAVNPLQFAFLGALVGALFRPLGGMLADKLGGAIVTLWDFVAMILATAGVIYFISGGRQNFAGFLILFIILFMTTGIANGSIFRVIPHVFRKPKEAAATVGFSSAIAAYGAYFVPQIFGWSLNNTGSARAALDIFIACYVISLFVTWFWYVRGNAETNHLQSVGVKRLDLSH